jgi:D-alanyl-D-alanine carboxypeptidase (penicillin-binding protein 5/6)
VVEVRNEQGVFLKIMTQRCLWLGGKVALCALSTSFVLLVGCGGGDADPIPEMPSSPSGPSVEFVGRSLEPGVLPLEAAVVYEPHSKTFLYDLDGGLERPPASLVKMMVELVAMREIDAGRLALTDSVRVSASSSTMGGSQVYLKHGEKFTVGQLLQSIAIASANDACVALAEHVAGTPRAFVELMNREAQDLGLENTTYVNVHGLDDDGEINYTTPHDIAKLATELIKYPDVREWSSTEKAPFRNGEFILENTNKLVGKFAGLDGLKTGFTTLAGFCLCATAERDGLRLISVVMGCGSKGERVEATAELLGLAFASYEQVEICKRGEVLDLEVEVPGAKVPTLRPVASRDLTVIVSRPDDRSLETRFEPRSALKAPLQAWEPVGLLQVISRDEVLAEVPVLAGEPIAASGLAAWIRSRF